MPKPNVKPLKIKYLFLPFRIQAKKNKAVSVKKKISIVSINASRESQMKPGINPKKMLASNPIFGEYNL
jgi:hypothetical protein